MRRPVVAILLGLVVALLPHISGCAAGDGPRLSGFAIGDTHLMKVGETIELRLPLREDGSRQWRVTSYDSLYLAVAARPRMVTGPGGQPEMLLVGRAKALGDTEIEVREVGVADRAPRVKRFKVSITQ